MMSSKHIASLIIVILIIVGSIVYINIGKVKPVISNAPAVEIPLLQEIQPNLSTSERLALKTKQYERAKEIASPAGFVNTGDKPIQIADYIGKKVILLDIWTYSCINCIRTLPYINEWYSKYEDKGLVVIGIHTPEFEFEKKYENVKAAVEKFGIKFPVVLDNEYGTWSAYKNLYWPRKYIIDIDGFIRYDHIGEGGYDETEKKIQELLKERGDVLGTHVVVDMPVTKKAMEQSVEGQSPETYLGGARNQYLDNGIAGQTGIQKFVVPSNVTISKLYFDGSWDIQPEYATNSELEGRIIYPFAAKKVFLVMSADTATNVELLVDGKPLGVAQGEDVKTVNGKSIVTVSTSRLYSLYTGEGFGAHVLEIKPLAKGLKAFAFTFGN